MTWNHIETPIVILPSQTPCLLCLEVVVASLPSSCGIPPRIRHHRDRWSTELRVVAGDSHLSDHTGLGSALCFVATSAIAMRACMVGIWTVPGDGAIQLN